VIHINESETASLRTNTLPATLLVNVANVNSNGLSDSTA